MAGPWDRCARDKYDDGDEKEARAVHTKHERELVLLRGADEDGW